MADMTLCMHFVNGRIESLQMQFHWFKRVLTCKRNENPNFWKAVSRAPQTGWVI